MHRLLSRFTYANVVATFALLFAVSTGGAWAATSMINGSKIKRNTITGKQVKNGSLTGADIAKGSLTADRLARGVLAGAVGSKGEPGAAGAAGAAGAPGAAGAKGDTGDRGPSDAYFTELPYTGVPGVPMTTKATVHSLDLPAGKYFISGVVTFKNEGPASDGVLCDLTAVDQFQRAVNYAPVGGFGQVTVERTVSLDTATTVTLACSRDAANSIRRYSSALSAIRVATITTS
jgi:hypothetical protein